MHGLLNMKQSAVNYPSAIKEAHENVDKTFKLREQDRTSWKIWLDACRRFRDLFTAAHLDSSFYPNEDALRIGEEAAVEVAIKYLELDPYYFRSGYSKERILRILKKLELSKKQQDRLRNVILSKVDSHDCREFRAYCRLAKKLNDEGLLKRLKQRSGSLDEGVKRRAIWMLKYCSWSTACS